jgi:arylsulfatase A-like enzyme
MTGQYPARTHNTDYFGGPNEFQELPESYDPAKDGKFGRFSKHPVLPAPYLGRLAAEHVTLAEAFKAAGYATMFAGKWHLGPEGSFPEDHGFDINIGGNRGGGPYGGDKYFSPYGNPQLPDGPKGEHLPDRLASEVSKFIAAKKDQPFFVSLCFYSVHTPLIGRPDLVKKYEAKRAKLGLKPAFAAEAPRKNRIVQEHAIYAAMVEAMDQAVGKVLDALESNGVADDTIVMFFSDNGGLSTSEGSPTTNLPYRAGKGWAYEGGVREPLLVRLPGKVKAGTSCDVPVISTDFYPTLLEATGQPLKPEQHKDGTSFVDLLKDPAAKHERAPLLWHYPHWGNQGGIPYSAVRDGDWKLIRFHWRKGTELYNLADDPGESRDLAAKEPERVARMEKQLDDLLKDTKAIPSTLNPKAKKPFDKW